MSARLTSGHASMKGGDGSVFACEPSNFSACAARLGRMRRRTSVTIGHAVGWCYMIAFQVTVSMLGKPSGSKSWITLNGMRCPLARSGS